MRNFLIVALLLIIVTLALLYYTGTLTKVFTDGSSSGSSGGEVERDPYVDAEKDLSIQEYNLRERMKTATVRFPGDTLDLMKFVLENMEEGTYLADIDRVTSTTPNRSAVLYWKGKNATYVFGVVAKSAIQKIKDLIEVQNFIGYDASFVDYDSTDLGTAMFFLTCFKYENDNFSILWEKFIPTSGGLQAITQEEWPEKKIPYVKVLFYDAPYLRNNEFRYFLLKGFENPPHLLMLYSGINSKRTMGNVDNDSIPDYYEFVYIDNGNMSIAVDSVPFTWKDTAYFNIRNKRQWKYY